MKSRKKLLIEHLAPWWGIGLTFVFLIVGIIKFYYERQTPPPQKNQVGAPSALEAKLK